MGIPWPEAQFTWMRLPRRVTKIILCGLLTSVLIGAGCKRRSSEPPILTIVGLGLDAGEQLKRDAIDGYTSANHIKVSLIPAWGTSEEQLTHISKLLKLGSNQPDIYVTDVIWPGTLGPDLLDLTDYV